MTTSAEERKFVLYNASTSSPYGQRVLMAFKEAGAEYETVSVDMADREWYKAIYPEAKVPVVKYNGDIIPDSMIIIELIHDLYPNANLFPSAEPVKKAKMKFFVRLFEEKLLPLNGKLLSNPPLTKKTYDVYVEEVTKAYRRLNDLLLEQASSGPYYLGTKYSAVDIALAPFIYNMTHFIKFLTGRDYEVLDKLPRLREFLVAITDHPTFKATLYLTPEILSGIVAERLNAKQNMFA